MHTLDDLWDFDDPAGSEARFREAIAAAAGEERAILTTQLARAMGLQGNYGRALATLISIEQTSPEIVAWVELECGRVLRSSGDTEGAGPHFEIALEMAEAAGNDALQAEALRMLHARETPDR